MAGDIESELRPLLVAAQAGDRSAYRAFLDKVTPRLRAFVRGRLARSGGAEIEDIVQETLLAIHLSQHTYSGASPVTAWVHAIARYKVIDHLRASGRAGTSVPIEAAEEAAFAAEDHAATETALDLDRALATLPPRMRSLIEAVKLEGLSVAEVAERNRMSESAVKVTVHRALKRLMQRFAAGRGITQP